MSPQIICPICQTRHSVQPYNVDITCTCNSGDPVLDQEDKFILGDRPTDGFDNSIITPGQNALQQGGENRLFGTRAGVEGANVDEFTSRGRRKSTHFARQRFVDIDLKNVEVANKDV